MIWLEKIRAGLANSGDAGGGGGIPYPLHETYLGKWLALVRIQSAPVSIITLCVGYLTTAETVLTPAILPLLAVGFLSHFALYAHNDIHDYEYDLEHKDDSKPLLSDRLDREDAIVGTFIMLCISLSIAFFTFGVAAYLLFIAAVALGIIYNVYSKTKWWSGFILFLWGVCITLSGAVYAGTDGFTALFLGAVVGAQMLMFTILGDLKDIEAWEPSIPRKIITNTEIVGNLLYSVKYLEPDTIRYYIVLYTVVSTFAILAHFSHYIGANNAMFLASAGVLWGLGWQKVMYGKAFYFP